MREPGFVVLDMEYTYERNALIYSGARLQAFNTMTAASNRWAISLTEEAIVAAASEKEVGKRIFRTCILGCAFFREALDPTVNWSFSKPASLADSPRTAQFFERPHKRQIIGSRYLTLTQA